MIGKTRFLGICLICFAILLPGISFAKKFDDKGFQFSNWQNPVPRFSDLGLNIDDVRTIIGDSQLLISHKGCDIELWANEENKVKKFKDARFVSSLIIFNLPKDKVIKSYFDFENYPSFIPPDLIIC